MKKRNVMLLALSALCAVMLFCSCYVPAPTDISGNVSLYHRFNAVEEDALAADADAAALMDAQLRNCCAMIRAKVLRMQADPLWVREGTAPYCHYLLQVQQVYVGRVIPLRLPRLLWIESRSGNLRVGSSYLLPVEKRDNVFGNVVYHGGLQTQLFWRVEESGALQPEGFLAAICAAQGKADGLPTTLQAAEAYLQPYRDDPAYYGTLIWGNRRGYRNPWGNLSRSGAKNYVQGHSLTRVLLHSQVVVRGRVDGFDNLDHMPNRDCDRVIIRYSHPGSLKWAKDLGPGVGGSRVISVPRGAAELGKEYLFLTVVNQGNGLIVAAKHNAVIPTWDWSKVLFVHLCTGTPLPWMQRLWDLLVP